MKIEIFEEDGDNILSFGDKYADFTIDVYPESKTYQSRMNLKEDCYYRTEEFEYRIQTNPLKVESRLTERVDEPPERYCVKDGVVLESDILADRKELAMTSMTKEFIDGLKKEVEWHEDWVGNPVSMYILSKHPEIISTDDYRRHLRQFGEKIKTALIKLANFLKNDSFGFQIKSDDNQTYIGMYSTEEDSVKDFDEYYNLKDGQKAESVYGKKLIHLEKITKAFFDKNSNEYVGISGGEFRMSKDILENIDTFLNKKPVSRKKEETQKVSFGVRFGAIMLQWIWLFFVVSVLLWLLSLVVSIFQYSFIFAIFVSGVLTLILTSLQIKRAEK